MKCSHELLCVNSWVSRNSDAIDDDFFVDVIYSIEMFDTNRKHYLRYINTWFEKNQLSHWVYNRRLNRYELKTEADLCEIRFGSHGNRRTSDRIDNQLLTNTKKIILDRIRREGVVNNEVVLIVIDHEGQKQGYVICIRCDDVLIKHLKVITAIGHREKYFSKDRIIHIKIRGGGAG
jgi:hypothetical protein